MTYQHGVRVSESSAGARPAAQVDSALPVYVGTASVHETGKRDNVNKPILLASLAEAVAALGPIGSENGTLSEPCSVHFSGYATGPIVAINVLDPSSAEHQTTATEEEHEVADASLPIDLDHRSALSVSLVERSTTGDNEVADLAYVGTGNGTLGAVLAAPDDEDDIGDYSATCASAATPEDYAIESLVYAGTGTGTAALILIDADPTDDGSYTLTCTAPAGGTAAEFQLAKGGVSIGAVILADGTTQERGGIAVTIAEGGVAFLAGDAWIFDVAYTAAVAAAFTVVTPATPGGTSVDADGSGHVVDGITVTIAEGATPFEVGDEWTWSVATTAEDWATVDAADYSLTYEDETDNAQLVPADGGAIVDGDTIRVTYVYLDESKVDAADIVAGLDVVHLVYPSLLKVPALILAPQWSHNATVSAKMATVAGSVSGQFRAHAIVDLDSDVGTIATYADAAAAKAAQGLAVEDVSACWPAVVHGDDDVNRLSVHVACLCGVVDAARGGVPYASPSNQSLTGVSAAVQTDGGEADAEVYLTRPQANDGLNAQGIITALNSPSRGWILWGNRTAIYPTDTDPRLSFLAVRRMMNYLHNTIILTVERDVDQPGNRRLIDGVVQTIQAWLNGLVAAGALVSGTIDFREADNSTTAMADGTYVFYVQATPPSPGRDLAFNVEYDSSTLSALFE